MKTLTEQQLAVFGPPLHEDMLVVHSTAIQNCILGVWTVRVIASASYKDNLFKDSNIISLNRNYVFSRPLSIPSLPPEISGARLHSLIAWLLAKNRMAPSTTLNDIVQLATDVAHFTLKEEPTITCRISGSNPSNIPQIAFNIKPSP